MAGILAVLSSMLFLTFVISGNLLLPIPIAGIHAITSKMLISLLMLASLLLSCCWYPCCCWLSCHCWHSVVAGIYALVSILTCCCWGPCYCWSPYFCERPWLLLESLLSIYLALFLCVCTFANRMNYRPTGPLPFKDGRPANKLRKLQTTNP